MGWSVKWERMKKAGGKRGRNCQDCRPGAYRVIDGFNGGNLRTVGALDPFVSSSHGCAPESPFRWGLQSYTVLMTSVLTPYVFGCQQGLHFIASS